MNKGIIYKVKIDDDFHYYIRLEKPRKLAIRNTIFLLVNQTVLLLKQNLFLSK